MTTLILPSRCTPEMVDRLAEEWSALVFAPGEAVTVHASAVEIMSAAGAQLLVSLHKSAAASECRMIIQTPTNSLAASLMQLGLGWLLAEPA